MKDMLVIDWIASVITISGALVWGLRGVGIHANVLQELFSSSPSLERVVYLIIGLSGLWLAYALLRIHANKN